MLHLVGRLISIKYAAICNRENIAKFLIYEKRAVLSTPLLLSFQNHTSCDLYNKKRVPMSMLHIHCIQVCCSNSIAFFRISNVKSFDVIY